MTERGMIFSTEMVPRILDGSKTVTRRLIKLRDFDRAKTIGYDWMFRDSRLRWHEVSNDLLLRVCGKSTQAMNCGSGGHPILLWA